MKSWSLRKILERLETYPATIASCSEPPALAGPSKLNIHLSIWKLVGNKQNNTDIVTHLKDDSNTFLGLCFD